MSDRKPLEFVALHAPYFHITGRNLGDKIDTRVRKDVKLEWEPKTQLVYVTVDGVEGFFPAVGNLKGAFVTAPAKINPVTTPPSTAEGRKNAQVSTPQSHVFAGAGHGKSR